MPGPVRPIHSKWLVVVDLHRDLRELLPRLHGRVLDVGCGEQPYRVWLTGAAEYVGIDVEGQPNLDALIVPGEPWPLASDSFDAVLCTQVLEHDSRPAHTLSEIRRVLAPGGTAVVTVPFAYNEHLVPHDYSRWSAAGAEQIVGERLHVLETRKQGGAGSLLGALWLNWLDHMIGRRAGLQLARAAFLPLWLGCCGFVNLVARGIDRMDPTGAFYLNVMVVAYKPALADIPGQRLTSLATVKRT